MIPRAIMLRICLIDCQTRTERTFQINWEIHVLAHCSLGLILGATRSSPESVTIDVVVSTVTTFVATILVQ